MNEEVKQFKEIEIDKLLMRLRNGLSCSHQEIIDVIKFYREKAKDLEEQYSELSRSYWDIAKYHQ